MYPRIDSRLFENRLVKREINHLQFSKALNLGNIQVGPTNAGPTNALCK